MHVALVTNKHFRHYKVHAHYVDQTLKLNYTAIKSKAQLPGHATPSTSPICVVSVVSGPEVCSST